VEISVLLNGATPAELAACCRFVARAYPVGYDDFLGRVGDPTAALEEVPRDWDYVVDDGRSRDPRQLEFTGVRRYYQAAHRHFRARVHHGTAGSEPTSRTGSCGSSFPRSRAGGPRRNSAKAASASR
jgi:hypothetical protein